MFSNNYIFNEYSSPRILDWKSLFQWKKCTILLLSRTSRNQRDRTQNTQKTQIDATKDGFQDFKIVV